MVQDKAPQSRRDTLIQSVESRRKVVIRAASRHAKQYRLQQYRWMRHLSNRIAERRIRAQWFQKVETVAFHSRLTAQRKSVLGTLALCAAVPATVPTILATSPSTAITHRNSLSRPAPVAVALVSLETPAAAPAELENPAPADLAAAPADSTAPLSAPAVATDPSPGTASAALPAGPSLPQRAIEAVTAIATPKLAVRVVADGHEQRASLALPVKSTVASVLQEMKIVLAETDRVWPDRNAPATNGMSIRVTRVRVELRKRQEQIPFETLFQPSTEIRPASRKVVQPGQPGAREIAERIWFKEGKVSGREPLSDRIVRAPRPQIIALGTRSAYLPTRIPYHNRYARAYALAARGGLGRERLQMQIPAKMKPLRAVRSITLVATGYSPDPRENGGWTRTATGLPIGYGAAAVDPRVVPLGTKMYIEGYGYAFACDTGGAIKGNRIDLAYDSYHLANTKGRKRVKAWILQ